MNINVSPPKIGPSYIDRSSSKRHICIVNKQSDIGGFIPVFPIIIIFNRTWIQSSVAVTQIHQMLQRLNRRCRSDRNVVKDSIRVLLAFTESSMGYACHKSQRFVCAKLTILELKKMLHPPSICSHNDCICCVLRNVEIKYAIDKRKSCIKS